MDDLEGELDEFVTYQVRQPAAPIGRPPSPKYTKELKRGGTMLTAERTKSFLEGVMDKQIHDLRSQTQGVGNFEKGASLARSLAAFALLHALRKRGSSRALAHIS